MIEHVSIQNFTVFEKLNLTLSPKVNVIMGTNGTGKTHLLKAIYGLGIVALGEFPSRSNNGFASTLSGKFLRLFSTEDEKLGKLHTIGAKKHARLCLQNSNNSTVEVTFGNRSKFLNIHSQTNTTRNTPKPVYIPTKEVLSLVRSIHNKKHDHATVETIFDDGDIDLAELLIYSSVDKENNSGLIDNPRLSNIIRELVKHIGGRYCWKSNHGFNFEPGSYQEVNKTKTNASRSNAHLAKAYKDSTITRFVSNKEQVLSSDMTAEGYRKIGALHRLLCNGSINPGKTGILLWDEPEANLNPKMMKTLVQVLLELSRNGQQIIVATHDYVFLKWLDLLMDDSKDDHVRFHAIYKDTKMAIPIMTVESADSYSLISKTAISDSFAELFDQDVSRAFGRAAT
ncbi:MAG: AAA family ATPase [Aestuariivita sp.]|nr:AAA family ATPase [Aestuariivita sp.]